MCKGKEGIKSCPVHPTGGRGWRNPNLQGPTHFVKKGDDPITELKGTSVTPKDQKLEDPT